MRRFVRLSVSIALTLMVGCGPTTPESAAPPSGSTDPAASLEPAASPSLDAALIGASAGFDPLYPTLGNGGYDVARYLIGVTTDPATNDTTLRIGIEAEATQRLGRFSLDYAGIDISAIEVDGQATRFEHADGKLTIDPPSVIEDGASFLVSVDIEGRPTAVRGAGWTWLPDEQVSAFGLYDAVPTWLPVNADPAEKAIVEFRVVVPMPYVAVAPGVLVGTTDVAEGREFHWRAGPTSGFTLTIREYEVVDLGVVAGIPLHSYQPPDLPDGQRRSIAVIPSMLEHFVDRYGPYPFEELNVVWVDGRTDLRGSDEGILHWGPQLREPRALAHHLTHLWFQVNATPATAHESFLRAAFANYADLLWVEKSQGVDARNGVLGLWHSRLGERTDPPADPARAAANEALFSRGPLALHALRVRIGDEAFFEILRAWVTRFHRGSASVGDFVALAEEVSGRALDDWEAGWLREEAVPPRSELGLPPG